MRSFHLSGRSTVHAMNGMCATSHPLASQCAVKVLRDGGNAVDAAIAAVALLSVIEPAMTGIGGDCFALLCRDGDKPVGYNGSGRSAACAHLDWFKAEGITAFDEENVHTVTVPGAIEAWSRILTDHGTLSLETVLQPAIEAAENGFVIPPRVAHDWGGLKGRLQRDEGGARHYLFDGETPVVGDVVDMPALARTLKMIAADGPDAFYKGAIAKDIVATLAAKGSLMTLDDFAAHKGDYVTPISTHYKGYDVFELPPSGQGITALVMLNILSRFDLKALGAMSTDRFHQEVEAARLAYSLSDSLVADPLISEVPAERMLQTKTADELAARIDMKEACKNLDGLELEFHSDTTYVSVVDKDRLAVSFINSLFKGFGSGIVTPETGVVLHNRGLGFKLEEGHPSCIAPSKRPFHTIIPAMVMQNGRPIMPFGVMGGAYQPIGHVHLLTNMFDFGMDLQEAIDFPRAFFDDKGLAVEEGVDEAVFEELAQRGHDPYRVAKPWGGAQAVWIDYEKGTLTGGSDPRKDGLALGY